MRSGPRSLAGAAVASVLLLVGPFGGRAHANAASVGEVRGRITLDLEGTSFEELGPVVVYLEATGTMPVEAPPRAFEILQKNAHFSPSFSVVVVGQAVEMKNADTIYHNVFSYSRPNDFDLGTYPTGQSRSVTFSAPGVVKTYCAIHENMNGTIVVTPTRHYDVASRMGRFELRQVPTGRYRLHVWSEKLPDVTVEVTVAAGQAIDLTIPLVPG